MNIASALTQFATLTKGQRKIYFEIIKIPSFILACFMGSLKVEEGMQILYCSAGDVKFFKYLKDFLKCPTE